MGTCASLHRHHDSALAGSKDAADPQPKVAASALEGSDFGSKDDIFFDSKPWMDSDCEDDFYSVRGDFTPSRGSTPVHPSSISVAPRFSKTSMDVFPVIPSEPSPRKKLAELLLETSNEEKDGKVEDEKGEKETTFGNPTSTSNIPSKTWNGTSDLSDSNHHISNETVPEHGLQNGKLKNDKVMQCCLPVPGALIFSTYERKNRRASPVHQAAVKA